MILLFAVGALAVDIGNALSRKRQVQTTADFAALAGARELPSAANAKASAYAYLLNNATSGMDTGSWTPAQFDDNNFANGEIDVVGTDRVQVTAPPRTSRSAWPTRSGSRTPMSRPTPRRRFAPPAAYCRSSCRSTAPWAPRS